MPNVFDNSEQVVFDLASRRKKEASASPEPQSEPVAVSLTAEDEARNKIANAKVHANKEIKQFKELVNNFVEEIEKLALFEDVAKGVKSYCLTYALETVIEPVLKGQCPMGMSQATYKEMRGSMYKELIKKYVNQ